jgi:hypothetical protein
MATDKMYTVVGVSKLNGEYKVRFANDTLRVKVLEKNGHEDVRLCELDSPASKYDAVKQIATMAEFSDAAAQSVIQEYLTEKAPKGTTGPAATRKAVEAEVA